MITKACGLVVALVGDSVVGSHSDADCRASMESTVCRPFEDYMATGGTSVVGLVHAVSAVENVCAEQLYASSSSTCGCPHLLESIQPSHFYELTSALAMSSSSIVASETASHRQLTTAAVVMGKVRLPYPVVMDPRSRTSMDGIKDAMVNALAAAGFNPVYTIIRDVAKDGLFAQLVFSTEPMHVPVGSGLTPEQHEEMVRTAYRALHECLDELIPPSTGEAPFQLDVFRGCPLDASPMEVEGEIEILNAEPTLGFRDRVNTVLRQALSEDLDLTFRNGVTGEDMTVATSPRGTIVAHTFAGSLVSFTIYTDVNGGGLRPHMDVLADLRDLRRHLAAAGIKSVIRVNDVRSLGGVTYNTKRVLYSYCHGLGVLTRATPREALVPPEMAWDREATQSALFGEIVKAHYGQEKDGGEPSVLMEMGRREDGEEEEGLPEVDDGPEGRVDEMPEAGIEPGISDGESPEDRVMDAVFGKEEPPEEDSPLNPVVPDGMDEDGREPEMGAGMGERDPEPEEGAREDPSGAPEEEGSSADQPWSPNVADVGQPSQPQPGSRVPRVRSGELKGMATTMGGVKSPVLPYRLTPGQRTFKMPIVTRVAGVVHYAPLFAPHPFQPRILFHPPAPHPPRAMVLQMPSAAQTEECAVDDDDVANTAQPEHSGVPHAVEYRNVLAPQEEDFVVGHIGRFPEPALETALTWVDKVALSTVEGLREKMEHLYGKYPSTANTRAFARFVKDGLFEGDIGPIRTMRGLRNAIKHVSEIFPRFASFRAGVATILDSWILLLTSPDKHTLVSLFREAPSEIYALMDANGDGLISFDEFTAFGRTIAAPSFVFSREAFEGMLSEEEGESVRVQDFEELYRTIAQGRQQLSASIADKAVQLVMDSLTLESRFSDLDGGRHNDLSLEDIGWKGPVGEALFFYLDSNRDGVLSRYEWQRLVIIHRAPLLVRRFALWVAHRVGDNLLPYSVEPFVTRAKERLGSMPERYVPVIKGALDSLGAGEPSDGDYGLLRAMAGGNEMNNLVATEFYLGYGRRPRLTSKALGADHRDRRHHRGHHHHRHHHHGPTSSFLEEGPQWSRLPLEYSLRKLSPTTRVSARDFADFGKSIKAPTAVFSRTAYDLLEYPSGRDAEDLLSTKSDVLHAVSKDLRNHRRIHLILDSLVLGRRFKELDANGDGELSLKELGLGAADRAVFAVVDLDGSNTLSLGELQRLAGFGEDTVPASAILLAQKVQAKADGPVEAYVAAAMRAMEGFTGFESAEIGELLDFDDDGYIDHREIAMLRVLSMPQGVAKYLPQSAYVMDKIDIGVGWSEGDFTKMGLGLQANRRAFSHKSFESLAQLWDGRIPREAVEVWMNAVRHKRLRRLLAVFSAVNTDAFFTAFDGNKDGKLSADELRRWMGNFPLVSLVTVLEVLGQGEGDQRGITREGLQRFSFHFAVGPAVKLLALSSIPRSAAATPEKFVKEFSTVLARVKSPRVRAKIVHALDLDGNGELSRGEILGLRVLHQTEFLLLFESLLHHGFATITEAKASSFLEEARSSEVVLTEGYAEGAFVELDSVYQVLSPSALHGRRKGHHSQWSRRSEGKRRKGRRHQQGSDGSVREAPDQQHGGGIAEAQPSRGSLASEASALMAAAEGMGDGRHEEGVIDGVGRDHHRDAVEEVKPDHAGDHYSETVEEVKPDHAGDHYSETVEEVKPDHAGDHYSETVEEVKPDHAGDHYSETVEEVKPDHAGDHYSESPQEQRVSNESVESGQEPPRRDAPIQDAAGEGTTPRSGAAGVREGREAAVDNAGDEELLVDEWEEEDKSGEYGADHQGGHQSRDNNTWSISMHEYPSEGFEKVTGQALGGTVSVEEFQQTGVRLGVSQAYTKEVFSLMAGKDASELPVGHYADLYRSFKDVRNLARVFHILDSIKMEMRFTDLDLDRDGLISLPEFGCGECKSDTVSEEECMAVGELFLYVADGLNQSSIARRNWQKLVRVDADTIPPAVAVVLEGMGEVPRQATNEEFIEKYMAEAGRYPGAREEAGAFLDDETGQKRNVGFIRVAAAGPRLAGFLPSSFDFTRNLSTLLKPGVNRLDEETFEEIGRHAEVAGDWFEAKSFGALLFPVGETLPVEFLDTYVTARRGGYLYDLGASLGAISMAARFDAIDMDGDGKLTREELETREWRKSIAGTMLFALLDLDRDSSISRAEWQHWGYLVAQARPHMRALALRILPEVKISASEYAARYRAAVKGLSPDEIKLVEQRLDFDADGELSEAEIGLLRVVGGGRSLRELLYREFFFGYEIVNTGTGAGQSFLQEAAIEDDRTLNGFMARVGALQSPYIESARFAFQFLDTDSDGQLSDNEMREFELMRMLFADYGFLRFIADFTALTAFKKLKGPAGGLSLKGLIDSAKAGDCTPTELAMEIHDAFEIDLPDGTVEVPWAIWRLIVWRHLTNEHDDAFLRTLMGVN
ncbi:hypothetical protein Pmar_PMAR010074 [Perkinsus marinus ATCC 50983]|uniref:EF-hand domain-containing protein n=1 Tax=Perkinsus marinus (strain ATCC 50983 / TXsc) TaxID=423536 RepID=C5K4R7_PERM5|nr:hypothetical protein Pmar_PMAR010074 [Perkinsus marinus ATCC 50983]EER20339.1 hypothetical protein Pmar_PMAR010074 [Perkinsus marinus ATCC 50983]|eukprot:XP_002788543.1 hypothetical protein Pmar_PMAR010074 [Perkinsus marinus ATCC 50983]